MMRVSLKWKVFFSFISVLLLGGFLSACTPPAPKIIHVNTLAVCPSDISVLVWANEAIVSAMSYNFATYPQNFERASHYFTPVAWNNYQQILRSSQSFERVLKKNMIVSAVAEGAPMLLHQGVESNGVCIFTAQMPVLVVYQNQSIQKKQHIIVTLRIAQTAPPIGVRGLAIEGFVIRPAHPASVK